MTGVDVNVLSIVTVGNNVLLMTGVDVNVLPIVTVGNNVSFMTGVDDRQFICIYTRHI
jgi:acetyltransferase-like isoleucine patch superfamily enzyme